MCQEDDPESRFTMSILLKFDMFSKYYIDKIKENRLHSGSSYNFFCKGEVYFREMGIEDSVDKLLISNAGKKSRKSKHLSILSCILLCQCFILYFRNTRSVPRKLQRVISSTETFDDPTTNIDIIEQREELGKLGLYRPQSE